jgi:hypothetical protein
MRMCGVLETKMAVDIGRENNEYTVPIYRVVCKQARSQNFGHGVAVGGGAEGCRGKGANTTFWNF